MATRSKQAGKELPSRGAFGWFIAATLLGFSLVALCAIRLSANSYNIGDDFEKIAASRRFLDRDMAMVDVFTGIKPVDDFIRAPLVAAFMAGPAGWNKGYQAQMFYFLISFWSVLCVWTVEACRQRNKGTIISFTSIWALFYQTVGGGVIIPLFYLAYLRVTSKGQYWTASSRQVPLSYAKAILPAMVVGYLVPTVAMFCWPDSSPDMRITQYLVALWQPTPWIVNTILMILSTVCYGGSETTRTRHPSQTNKDVKYLDRVYVAAFVVTALAHFTIIAMCLYSSHPEHTLIHIFISPQEFGQSAIVKSLHTIFIADYWTIFLPTVLWAFLAVWDLKRVGQTKVSLTKAATVITLESIIVGPAATLASVWYWREHEMLGDKQHVL